MFVANLPSLIDKETIYDKTGHVDTEFLQAILEFMSRMSQITNDVNKSLARLLGIEEMEDKKKGNADNGSRWSVEEILKHCTLEGNVMKLPNVQFNKKSYLEAKKWIEEAGGSWQGGKLQGFTFPFDPNRVFSILHDGKRCNLQQEYQFFETPASIADWLVMLAGGIDGKDNVLEPSAGRGAIIKAIHRACPEVVVDCFELMPENKEFLSAFPKVNIVGDEFNDTGKRYSKIIANPPFSNNQDIKHVQLMYQCLEPKGTLVAITSRHWLFATERVCQDFRAWLGEVHGEQFEIKEGEFKESGTSIATMAIKIIKQ